MVSSHPWTTCLLWLIGSGRARLMAAQAPRAFPEEFAEFAPSQPSPGQQAPSSSSQQQPPDTLFSGPGVDTSRTAQTDRQTDRQTDSPASDLQTEIASPRDQHIYVPVRWTPPHYLR